MDLPAYDLIGVGLYTVPEASRLTRVSAPRIRRWIRGYAYRRGDTVRSSDPVWRAQLPVVGNAVTLGFLDLMEVRFVDAFRESGVPWRTIRVAAERAAALFGCDHPFAARRFVTDGRRIFADIAEETGEGKLLDLVKNQYAFRRVVSPTLIAGLDFSPRTQVVERWWPLGRNRHVVIDPRRSFGQPIVDREGVPTSVLAAAYRVEKSFARVGALYDVSAASVRSAVRFEVRLAA